MSQHKVECPNCGNLGWSSDEAGAQRRLEEHAKTCQGLRPEDVERARQYLICQERGHRPGNFRTASIPPQDVCEHCGTYFWFVVTRTLREGMRKPPPAAIEAAQDLIDRQPTP